MSRKRPPGVTVIPFVPMIRHLRHQITDFPAPSSHLIQSSLRMSDKTTTGTYNHWNWGTWGGEGISILVPLSYCSEFLFRSVKWWIFRAKGCSGAKERTRWGNMKNKRKESHKSKSPSLISILNFNKKWPLVSCYCAVTLDASDLREAERKRSRIFEFKQSIFEQEQEEK